MKIAKRLFFQISLSLAMVCSIVACETDCVPKETIIENKLTPEVLSYFPYDSLDTIHCIIDSQQNLTIRSFEKKEGIQKFGFPDFGNCGTDVFYDNHYRIVNYFDQIGRPILWTKLGIETQGTDLLSSNTYTNIDFSFINVPISRDYSIIILTPTKWDTATINGHFYDDVITRYSNPGGEIINYSKSNGLVRIKSGGKSLFQLVK